MASEAVPAPESLVVQLFTAAVDDVRKAEAKQMKLPDTTRWAVLKALCQPTPSDGLEAIPDKDASIRWMARTLYGRRNEGYSQRT